MILSTKMSTLSLSEKGICAVTNFLDMFENENKMIPWIFVRNLLDICEIFVRYWSHKADEEADYKNLVCFGVKEYNTSVAPDNGKTIISAVTSNIPQ